MQLWPATIASPSREAYPHGGYNYSVFPQQNTTVVINSLTANLLATQGARQEAEMANTWQPCIPPGPTRRLPACVAWSIGGQSGRFRCTLG